MAEIDVVKKKTIVAFGGPTSEPVTALQPGLLDVVRSMAGALV
jgi:hypothetical protein